MNPDSVVQNIRACEEWQRVAIYSGTRLLPVRRLDYPHVSLTTGRGRYYRALKLVMIGTVYNMRANRGTGVGVNRVLRYL